MLLKPDDFCGEHFRQLVLACIFAFEGHSDLVLDGGITIGQHFPPLDQEAVRVIISL
jgi:hypothetical protein